LPNGILGLSAGLDPKFAAFYAEGSTMSKNWKRTLHLEGLENRRVFTGPVDIETISDDPPAIVDVLSSTARAINLEADAVDQAMFQMGPMVDLDGFIDGSTWTFFGQVHDGNGDDVELGGALTGVTVTPDANGLFSYESAIPDIASGEVTATVPDGDEASFLFN